MAVLKRQFFYHEKGNHDERWCYLARDTETRNVYVIVEWAARADQGEQNVDLAEFLRTDNSTARSNLLTLIGSLVPDA